MKKLSKGQLKAASEIFGNISVAWFTAGVISPLFIFQDNLLKHLLTFIAGIPIGGLLQLDHYY